MRFPLLYSVAAVNERFQSEISKVKQQLSHIPNFGVMENKINQLMLIVSQFQNSENLVLDLKAEKKLLVEELNRRKSKSSVGGLQKRTVMHLAKSQSDSNFSLPKMFPLDHQ